MRLLIVGKLDSHVTEASKIAKDQGANVVQCADIESAITVMVSGKSADAIFVDAKLNIATLVAALKQDHITVTLIAYGTETDSTLAVAAIKAGADEYIPLPPDAELIAAVLSAVTDEKTNFLYNSEAMKQVVSLANKVAPSEASILITGPSGTGKEVIAHYIHNKSKRANHPFISVNCAAIPDNLLESELFGHEKGAFTGATHKRIGKFEESDNGTLLLDEISEMDVRLQAKLLRAIQEKEIDRVGGSAPIKLNLRILATTNRDLQTEVAEGRFREDLLFRLNVIELKIPPLNQRIEDIKLLTDHFVEKFSEANNIPVRPLSDGAMNALTNHPWIGNVRELENTIHRAVLLSSGNEIQEADLLLQGSTTTSTESSSAGMSEFVGRTVDDMEKQLILNTLDHCSGNRTQAATILGISIRTLRNKLNNYSQKVA